jgi:hypothetical protein
MGQIQDFIEIAKEIIKKEQGDTKTFGFSPIFEFPAKLDYTKWILEKLKTLPVSGNRWPGLYRGIIENQIKPAGVEIPEGWEQKLISTKTNCVFIIADENDAIINIGKSEFPALVAILDKFIPRHSQRFPSGQKKNFTPQIWDQYISIGKKVKCFFCYDINFDPEILAYSILFEFKNRFGRLPVFNKKMPDKRFLPKATELQQLVNHFFSVIPERTESLLNDLPTCIEKVRDVNVVCESQSGYNTKQIPGFAPPKSCRLHTADVLEILEGEVGISYKSIFFPFLDGAKIIRIFDPYIRLNHQFNNLMAFCKTVIPKDDSIQVILTTKTDPYQENEIISSLTYYKELLLPMRINFNFEIRDFHDRFIESDIGWKILLSRGLDIFQKYEGNSARNNSDQTKRKCRSTTITYIRTKYFN